MKVTNNAAISDLQIEGQGRRPVMENPGKKAFKLNYTLREDGYYYPNLKMPEQTNYKIGKFGRMRCRYLKSYREVEYMELYVSGKLNEYLHQIDEACFARKELLVEQIKATEGVTEALKAQDQMEWVGTMNNIHNRVEEIIRKEFIYL